MGDNDTSNKKVKKEKKSKDKKKDEEPTRASPRLQALADKPKPMPDLDLNEKVPEKKQKKQKKQKRKEEDEEDKKARKKEKKDKKEKKRKRKEKKSFGDEEDAETKEKKKAEEEEKERKRILASPGTRHSPRLVAKAGLDALPEMSLDGQPAKKQKVEEKKQKKSKPSSKSGFRRDFYVEHDNLKSLSLDEVKKFRDAAEMNVEPEDARNPYKPIRTFDESRATFTQDMLAVCAKFEKPSPIQSQCWPIVLSGKDVIGVAETGSGKTVAFTLPGLVHIKDQPPVSRSSPGPIMLVLSPTRELAMQIAEVCDAAGKACNIGSVCIYGGAPKGPQKKMLDAGVSIVVATPGRLWDFVQEGSCSLERCTYLVLDEADRMLDQGFEKEIRGIIGKTHKDRQTLMFTATWPKEIQDLGQDYLQDPVKVTIGSTELTANIRVKQIVEVIDQRARDQRLLALLADYHRSRKNRVLVFVLYKKEAARIERFLQQNRWTCVAIHGDMSQEARTKAFSAFKDGSVPILVATDVAARGLDIPNVEYVINYSFPLTIEDYVHRIGRTGRAGKSGISHTMFTLFDKSHSGELINVLREANQEVPDGLMKFGTTVKPKKQNLKFTAEDVQKMNKKKTFDSDSE